MVQRDQIRLNGRILSKSVTRTYTTTFVWLTHAKLHIVSNSIYSGRMNQVCKLNSGISLKAPKVGRNLSIRGGESVFEQTKSKIAVVYPNRTHSQHQQQLRRMSQQNFKLKQIGHSNMGNSRGNKQQVPKRFESRSVPNLWLGHSFRGKGVVQ